MKTNQDISWIVPASLVSGLQTLIFMSSFIILFLKFDFMYLLSAMCMCCVRVYTRMCHSTVGRPKVNFQALVPLWDPGIKLRPSGLQSEHLKPTESSR